MNEADRETLELKIKEHCDRSEFGDAARLAVEGYGPEIIAFLMALLQNADAAADVFAQFCEDMWKGLPAFRWGSSFRTWAYTIARNGFRRHLRDPHRKRLVQLETSDLFKVQQRVRTQTLPFLLTRVKDRFASLRESLSNDDQTLLILRLDRRLSWIEIAEVMLEDEEVDDPREIKKKASALRKRYERLKARLRELAEKDGLMDEEF